MNGTMEFRCVALFAFLAMILIPGRMRAESSEAAKLDDVQKTSFGKLPDGTEIEQYTLKNTKGAVAKIISYAVFCLKKKIPDKSGKGADVVLGFEKLDGSLG